MEDKRSEEIKQRNSYETVEYKCPVCGAIASQTWTKTMNELFLKQIEGTICPDCDDRSK